MTDTLCLWTCKDYTQSILTYRHIYTFRHSHPDNLHHVHDHHGVCVCVCALFIAFLAGCPMVVCSRATSPLTSASLTEGSATSALYHQYHAPAHKPCTHTPAATAANQHPQELQQQQQSQGQQEPARPTAGMQERRVVLTAAVQSPTQQRLLQPCFTLIAQTAPRASPPSSCQPKARAGQHTQALPAAAAESTAGA